MNKYFCSECKKENVKLWRRYQSCDPELKCEACKPEAWYVPAVPTPERDGYWGYTSTPNEGVKWWENLPCL